jgi:predicted unusual protein kinase regulating ubiquinone biosynthesis (AarF/ABC1/UbiB family)
VRAWHHTEQCLVDVFGVDWRRLFHTFEHEPIGSGCVAQVYKATMNAQSFPASTLPTSVDKSGLLAYIPVAVKV